MIVSSSAPRMRILMPGPSCREPHFGARAAAAGQREGPTQLGAHERTDDREPCPIGGALADPRPLVADRKHHVAVLPAQVDLDTAVTVFECVPEELREDECERGRAVARESER